MPAAAPSRTSTPRTTRYLADPAHREEGGTPAIIESIRAGLVFQLKEAVGVGRIRAHEERLPRAGRSRRGRHEPAIEILGNLEAERLSIVSFVVRAPVGPLPAPQLRRRAAQRPVRHPVARRLLVRRPVRPPAARHRPRALARVRARDHRRLRGHQARLGAGELQLLHLRRRLRLRRRRRAPRRRATAGGCSATTASTRSPGCGGTATGSVEPPLRLARGPLRRRRRDGRTRAPTTAAARTLLAEHLRDGARDPRRGHAAGPGVARGRRCPRTSSTCAGSTCRRAPSPDDGRPRRATRAVTGRGNRACPSGNRYPGGRRGPGRRRHARGRVRCSSRCTPGTSTTYGRLGRHRRGALDLPADGASRGP